jgi:hypothetical protein
MTTEVKLSLRERSRIKAIKYYYNHKQKHAESSKRYKLANKEKKLAHWSVGYALDAGTLIKPLNCTDCGCSETLDAHHPDYSKPLEVVWLCRRCHKRRHATERENE